MCIRDSYEAALVCVPISSTSSVIDLLAERMRAGSLLVEISSVKTPVMESMRRAHSRGMRTVSIHPLFGPGIGRLCEGRAAIVEVADLEEEMDIASGIFPFELIPVSLEEHDRSMAWLALAHLLLNTFLSASDREADLLLNLQTTTLSWFTKLAAASLTQSDELTSELIELNPYFPEVLRSFLGDLSPDMRRIRAKIRRWRDLLDLRGSYRSLYR